MLNLKVVWRSAFEKLQLVDINILLILLNPWTGMSHAPIKTDEKLDKRFQLALDAGGGVALSPPGWRSRRWRRSAAY